MASQSLDDILLRVQEVALRVVAPAAEAVDREGVWPEEQLRALMQAGLGGLVVPADRGGLGQGLSGLVRVTETLGLHCASTAMCFGMHAVASAVIAAKATAEQQSLYLDPINAGRHITTLALSEPGTGAHFYLPHSRILHDGTRYVFDGTKSFITNGGHADSYVVNGVTAGEAANPGEFSCLVVPARSEGIKWGEPWRGTGMRGNSSRVAEFGSVELPATSLLGQEGDQTWYVFNVVTPYFLIAMAGTYLGIAQATLTETIHHMRNRVQAQSGRTIAQNPILQHRLGMLWASVEKARRLCYHAAEQGDTNGPDTMPALLSSKAEAAETAVTVVNECMTLMGGIGYAHGSHLDRHLRDARAGPVMSPTTDLLRSWTGRWLVGEPLLSGGE